MYPKIGSKCSLCGTDQSSLFHCRTNTKLFRTCYTTIEMWDRNVKFIQGMEKFRLWDNRKEVSDR